MNKRGAGSILLMIFEFLVVFGVIWLVTDVAYRMAESEHVKRVNANQDIVLGLDTLIASPAKTEILFPRDMSRHVVEFKDNVVAIYNETEPSWRTVRRHFITYGDFGLDEQIVEQENLFLFKIGPDLGVGSERPDMLLKHRAVEVETKDINWTKEKKIFLIPISGFTQGLAEYINSRARPFSPAAARNIPLSKRPDIIINIRYTKLADFRIIEVFYPDDPRGAAKNRKLAVLLNNKLIEKIPDIKRTQVRSADEDVFPILNDADIAVILTIDEGLKERSAEVYEAVYEALEEYFR